MFGPSLTLSGSLKRQSKYANSLSRVGLEGAKQEQVQRDQRREAEDGSGQGQREWKGMGLEQQRWKMGNAEVQKCRSLRGKLSSEWRTHPLNLKDAKMDPHGFEMERQEAESPPDDTERMVACMVSCLACSDFFQNLYKMANRQM